MTFKGAYPQCTRTSLLFYKIDASINHVLKRDYQYAKEYTSISFLVNEMPIPKLQSHYLPDGIHECTIDELKESFFCTNERRKILISKLEDYIESLRKFGITGIIVLDGSFVTSKEYPGDIDVILAITENQNYSVALPITQFDRTMLQTDFVKKHFELHLFVGFTDPKSDNGFDEIANKWIEFFSGTRGNVTIKKGLLMVRI